jgi:hypothetical protein
VMKRDDICRFIGREKIPVNPPDARVGHKEDADLIR